MNRRETLKSLLLGAAGAGVIASSACSPRTVTWTSLPRNYSYGRTEAEQQHDAELFAETWFSEHELLTIAVLCDIILPAEQPHGGALDAGLPEFVEFMVKDRQQHQQPLRDGIGWLDNYGITEFGADFIHLTEAQRRQICDRIAWPDQQPAALQPGIRLFSLMRDLTLTGYYTTEAGFRDLGYQGNRPNVWDGVPPHILQQHGLAYEAEWLAKCVDQSRRDTVAEWDDDMNLIS